ncbi:hypothetical protein DPMN_165037 [Dreissena polymorpha]|uniref:Uncharacterized protein n=1 Tax=Dreissena polymorpha TaxID=45954 RepID=A0A9D4IW01_DREPO|nr:hypothetical protein DPMN_165037 [Dreissena polymorpha]
MEYVIGPLDKGESLYVRPLSAPGEHALIARGIDFVEVNTILKELRPIEAVLLPLVRESFDNAGFQSMDLHWYLWKGSTGMTENLLEIKLQLYLDPGSNDGDSHILDMLPLALILNTTSQNSSEWKTYDYHFLNQGPFATAQDLLEVYNTVSIRKLRLPSG